METLRSKLKRLAERGWLAEEAGLFALPARNGNGVGEAVKPGGGLFFLGSQVPAKTNRTGRRALMEPYAQIPDAGSFAASADLFTILVEELQSAEAAGLTACELEDLLAERGREVRRQLLQDHLNLRAAREEQAARQHRLSATGADGVTRTRVATGHHRQLATLFGTVQVTRCAWRRPGAHDPQHHRTWVILVDGAGHQLDLIRSEAQRGGVTIHIVIDLIHVLEYIWEGRLVPACRRGAGSRGLGSGQSARGTGRGQRPGSCRDLRRGGRRLRTGTQRTGTDACVRYLTSKHEYLRYDQALTADGPSPPASSRRMSSPT